MNINYNFDDDYVNIKLTKLPDAYDPNKLLEKTMKEKYGTMCPCCGSDKIYDCISDYSYQHLKGRHEWWKFWKMEYCKKLKFNCLTCNAKWETDWFPCNMKCGD